MRTRTLITIALLALVVVVVPAAPGAAIDTDGPLNRVADVRDLQCAIYHEDSDTPGNISSENRTPHCGTAFGFLDGEMWNPTNVRFGIGDGGARDWVQVSRDEAGDGSVGNPHRVVTRVNDGVGGTLEVTQTHAYVTGDDAVLVTTEFSNSGVSPIQGVFYRRMNCNEEVHDPDSPGNNLHRASTARIRAGADGSITCFLDTPDLPTGDAAPRVTITPLTSGSEYVGAHQFDDMDAWNTPEETRNGYGNACTCTGEVTPDHVRIGLSWDVTIQAGAAVSFQHAMAFAPLGGAMAALPSTVEGGGGGGGGGGGETGDPAGISRHAGDSRFETAVAISQATFASAAGFAGDGRSALAVVLARADNFADAVAGAPFARAQEAPLLLTSTNSLHSATQAELQRVLAPGGTVFVLGGPVAISDAVLDAVRGLGYTVERVSGATRYATSVEIARRTTINPDEIWLADGNTFGNALVAGATAAGRDNAVVVLLNNADVAAEVQEYLNAERVSGGGDGYRGISVGPFNEPEEFVGVLVHDAGNPIDNAALIAGNDHQQHYFDPSATSAVAIASATTFPDGLAGGAHAALLGAPLLLVEGDSLASTTTASLEHLAPLFTAHVYGGNVAVSQAAAAAVAEHLT